MHPTSVILADGLLLNPLVPQAAELVSWGYNYWEQPDSPPDPPPSWDFAPYEWQNVQLLICSRVFMPSESGRDHPVTLRVAVIPGTNELRDWKANFHLVPTKVGGLVGRYRRGFALGGAWAWSVLDHHRGGGDVLGIFGHSYGGAMTVTAAAHAVRDGAESRLVAVLPFAAPRSTSRAATKLLNSKLPAPVAQQFILGFDAVPWAVLPLWWTRAFEVVYVSSDGTARSKYRFGAELKRAITKRGFQSAGDHGSERYRAWARSLPAAIPFEA